jgi:hypothetical protein
MAASLSCERAHIPSLNFSESNAVWPSPPIVAIIEDVEVVTGRRVLPDVFDRRDDVERLPS